MAAPGAAGDDQKKQTLAGRSKAMGKAAMGCAGNTCSGAAAAAATGGAHHTPLLNPCWHC